MCRKRRNFKKDSGFSHNVIVNIVIGSSSEESRKILKHLSENNLVPVDEVAKDNVVLKSKL